jgi:hypothetical protein
MLMMRRPQGKLSWGLTQKTGLGSEDWACEIGRRKRRPYTRCFQRLATGD